MLAAGSFGSAQGRDAVGAQRVAPQRVEGRKSYTKTKPLRYEEFQPLIEWWREREENERAWKVTVDEVLKYDDEGNLLSANLDLKNPSAGDPFEHIPPEELVAGIVEKERQILALMTEIQEALGKTP